MLEFDTPLVRLPGKIAWTVFYVPAEFAAARGTKGRITVRGTVDGVPFTGTLLPSTQGHYHVYNQAMRVNGGKAIGESVHVTLEADDAPRTLEIPDDVAAALAASPEAQAKFTAWPYYIQREELTKITSAKVPETRARRLAALIGKLAGT
jgi:hypothetical protein